MSTSNKGNPPAGAPGAPTASGGGTPNSYTRFIPREELGSFAAWSPQTFEQPPAGAEQGDVGVRKPTLAERAAAEVRPNMKAGAKAQHAPQATGAPTAAPRPAPAPNAKPAPARRPIVGGMPGQAEAEAKAAKEPAPAPALNVDDIVNEARQSGYQDGYRNGLAALESYKQTQAAQMAAYMSDQVGALASDFHHRLESLEQQLAGRIAGVALELARQVVRSELIQHPDVVVDVAEQALGALLASARQIVLRLHPDDHAMAQAQLTEMLAARGARLVPDASVTRGGCVVESDIAVVDASVEARWDRAAASLGHHAPWNGGKEAEGSTEVHVPESELEQDDWAEQDTPVHTVEVDALAHGAHEEGQV
ncbi:MAG: FliH/SctL family protein [Aquabacterium sp.]